MKYADFDSAGKVFMINDRQSPGVNRQVSPVQTPGRHQRD
jgi:hypothetical protein